MVDRQYQKEGPHYLIFTSDKQPNEWTEFFSCDDDLKAAMDRILMMRRLLPYKTSAYRGQETRSLGCRGWQFRMCWP